MALKGGVAVFHSIPTGARAQAGGRFAREDYLKGSIRGEKALRLKHRRFDRRHKVTKMKDDQLTEMTGSGWGGLPVVELCCFLLVVNGCG